MKKALENIEKNVSDNSVVIETICGTLGKKRTGTRLQTCDIGINAP